jgi:hypothetical protein
LGERIEIRRFDFTAKAAEVRLPHVIGDYKQDVGFLIRRARGTDHANQRDCSHQQRQTAVKK